MGKTVSLGEVFEINRHKVAILVALQLYQCEACYHMIATNEKYFTVLNDDHKACSVHRHCVLKYCGVNI